MQKLIISKNDSGQTLIKYLQRYFKEAPNGILYKQLRKKNITIDGKKAEGNEKLVEGNVIFVFMSDETIEKFRGNYSKDIEPYICAYKKYKNPLIVYEDNHIIIMNKPVGILSQKSTENDLSANEWLIGYLLQTNQTDNKKLCDFTPSVCNRLDRNTGGLILFGKTLFGTHILNNLLKSRDLSKYYLTIVNGNVEKESLIRGYLSKDTKKNIVTIKKESSTGSDYIETFYKPLRYNRKLDITLLEVKLITGKPHQIRSHLASINHPIIGDPKYGNLKKNELFKNEFGLKTQFLYAYKIIFPYLSEYSEVSAKEFSIDLKKQINTFFERT